MRYSIWLLILICCQAVAATLPPGFTESTVASGLVSPVVMEVAPDGRVFICEQNGALRVVKNGQLLPAPFLTVSTEFHLDRGLLGLAFDPNFTQNNFVYVLYTSANAPAHNIVSRFTANGDVAAPGSEVQLFHLTNMPNTHHCDASIMFGGDGKLYIGVADNANGNNAQSLTNMFGKILRINADGSIPSDNPFYSQTSGNNRAIWAVGLRNPFTFTFQRTTGRMIVNDVGWEHYDEINEGVRGANYGWPVVEGQGNNPMYRDPLFIIPQYNAPITGAAITGGVFYNPQSSQFPASYTGKYFFIDYISGWLRYLDMSSLTATTFATNLPANNVNLRVGNDGSLYYLQRGPGANTGKLMRIQYTLSEPPVITQQPQSQSAYPAQAITFSVSASGSSPFSYQWERDGAGIGGATNPSYTIDPVQLSDNGAQFRCVVSNAFGQVTSNAATLTVQQNDPPVAAITAPAAGFLYTAGQAVSFSGTATDAQDGALPASAFTWQIDQIRPNHSRPFIPPFGGVDNGNFVAPDEGQPDADVGYRIILTVIDSHGATNTVSRDIWGHTADVTLAANPPGLQVLLGGAPNAAPFTFTGVVGFRRSIGAPVSQTLNGVIYDFVSWSDGGAATHEIVTPAQNTTLTATYAQRPVPEIAGHPQNLSVFVTQPASFSVTASGGAPLSYQWQRNNVNIAGATAASYAIPSTQTQDNGAQFRCVVSNPHGTVTSNAATLTVLQNNPPTATIAAPAVDTLFTAGQAVDFSGGATDPEDGELPASALTWQVEQIVGAQSNMVVPPFSGSYTGGFTPPDQGALPVDAFYRITLTAVDSLGATHAVSRDVRPRTATLTLGSDPSGLQLRLNGETVATPYLFDSVVGLRHVIAAVPLQNQNNVTYEFSGWSDGGAAEHEIVTHAGGATLTALFSPRHPPVLSGMVVTPGTTVIAGTEVSFRCTATGTAPLSWRWRYGEGIIVGTNPDASEHVYELPGTFHATLTVSDRYGLFTTQTVTITVLPAPPGQNPPDDDPDDPWQPPIDNDPKAPIDLAQSKPMTITKASAQMNFAKSFSDSMKLTCIIAPDHTPTTFVDSLELNAGGVVEHFLINNSRGGSGNGKINIGSDRRSGGLAVRISLTRGDWRRHWAPADSNTKFRVLEYDVLLRLNQTLYHAKIRGSYKANGARGRWKQTGASF